MVLPKHRTTSTCPPQSSSFLDVLLVKKLHPRRIRIPLRSRDDKTYWRCTNKTCSCTVENMDSLAEAPHLVIGCTFCTSPNLFTQLVIVHGMYPDGWRIPLAFGLPPGKTQAHYKVFLDELSAFGVNPESVLSFFCRTLVRVALQSR